MNTLLILIGKFLSFFSKFLNLGSGSTWPGHIALSLSKNFIRKLIVKNSKLKIILIAGTNGKTTTGKLIQTILEQNGNKVFQNQAGANLLNGIASSLILNADLNGKINKEYAIFEIDENTLPLTLNEIKNPDYVALLNLFRDQLDRYGEVNAIARKWRDIIRQLPPKTTLILNADDPAIAYLGNNHKNTHYFGLNDHNLTLNSLQYASDSSYCPKCNSKLKYQERYYSHLGNWSCAKCGLKRPEICESAYPKSSLTGTYNKYNLLAALTISKLIGVNKEIINSAIKSFKPAFGRQEILNINSKKAQIFLSKNPTSLNESLRTICSSNGKNILLVLNDRIPDGRDISWIWDVDFEEYNCSFTNIVVSGIRIYDMSLRLKYAQFKNFQCVNSLSKAIDTALSKTQVNETLYILPTYSAMLETRKILTGKKIL